MRKRITIIIPTHERENLLKRALAYYSNFEYVNIIICDSSTKQSLIPIPIEMLYLHLPGYTFASKLFIALEKVSTPYTCLSADDDFFVESSLINSANFLKNNSDYVSVTGHYIHFILTDNKDVLFNSLYNNQAIKARECNDPSERVMNALSASSPLMLGLFKTEILKNSIIAASFTTKITNVEIACNIIPMIFGKSKNLPVFMMARDSKRYTIYNNSDNNINSVINDYEKYLSTDDGSIFQKSIVEMLSINLNINPKDAQNIFNETMNRYITAINCKKKLNTESTFRNKLKIIVRKSIPDKILDLRRRLMMKKIIIGDRKIFTDESYLTINRIIKEFSL